MKLSVEQTKHVTAIEVNPRMAAEVMQGTYVFFFSLTPFHLDLSGFLSSNADRLTANSTSQLSKSNLCSISKSAYQTLHIKFQIPSSSNIDLCSVSQFLCFSENLPSDLSPGQCPGKNKWTKETHHRLWLQAICKSGQCLSEQLPLPTSSWISRHPSRTSRPTPPVKFEEFDRMNKVIFSRPNKFEVISKLKESWRC